MTKDVIHFPDLVINKEIMRFFHCKECIEEVPEGTSPKGFQAIEVGYTEKGIQVWCTRHDINIIHILMEDE